MFKINFPITQLTPSEQFIQTKYVVFACEAAIGLVDPTPNVKVAALKEINVFGRAAPLL